MPHDMLVKLYNLENDWSFVKEQENKGRLIRKPIAPEKSKLTEWIEKEFGEGWKDEFVSSFYNTPKSCFIATEKNQIVGFACYDATALGFFGPTGVLEKYRGKGTGKALLLACMLDMKLKGYGYAAIGAVGPAEFYSKAVGAVKIPDSWPGAYRDLLGCDFNNEE